jgi:hypothetical protein
MHIGQRWQCFPVLVVDEGGALLPKAKKATPTPPATTPDKRTLKPHEVVLSPMAQSVIGIQSWGKFAGEADLAELLEGQREQFKKVQAGDMQPVEAMLYGQAKTLETIFTSLARRAAANDGLKQFQVNLTLALKAQAQCRATLEALAEIKNPRPVAFVKQANISNGPQQVNNGTPPQQAVNPAQARAFSGAGAHAEEISGPKNGLLEQQHGNYLDTRAQGTAGGADPHLEAVAAGHRAAHP